MNKMVCKPASANMEQHVVMKFLVNGGRRLQAQYSDVTISHRKISDLCKHFKESYTSVNDNLGSGGSEPTAVTLLNIQRVEDLIPVK